MADCHRKDSFSDREMLSDALCSQKRATGLYNQFANECMDEKLRGDVLHLLKEEHDIENELFGAMHKRGWYPVPAAAPAEVEKAKAAFSMVREQL